jgi:hypothetical protein
LNYIPDFFFNLGGKKGLAPRTLRYGDEGYIKMKFKNIAIPYGLGGPEFDPR